MIYDCKITRSCIYWKPDKRDVFNLQIEADSLEEAKKKLNRAAIRLEVRSGASKLVQEVLIKVDGEYVSILDKIVGPWSEEEAKTV